jgi:hypothetical protein
MSAPLRTCLWCCALAIGSTCIRADFDTVEESTIQLVRNPVIDVSKLADMRGGLSIAGLDYTIGAVMRTKVDGTVVLESALDFDHVTNADVTGTYVLNDSKGLTEITQDLSKNRMVATVINQADQRQIQVELGIDVTVHNFQALQGLAIRNKILNSIGSSTGN